MSARPVRTWDELLHAVRTRPAMYVGNTERRGVRRLVEQVLDASVEAAILGRVTRIETVCHADGSLSVTDDGPGCIAGMEAAGREGPASAFTSDPHPAPPRLASSGIGIGLWVVNGLSQWLEFEVRFSGGVTRSRFEQGKLQGDPAVQPLLHPGTRVRFRPDPEIFPDPVVPATWVRRRSQTLSYLVPGVEFIVRDEARAEESRHQSHVGLGELVQVLNTGREVWHSPVSASHREPDLHIDAAIQFGERAGCEVLSFANHFHTWGGGHHEEGLREGLVQGLNDCMPEGGWPGHPSRVPDGLDRGYCAVVSVRQPRPTWEGASRQRLGDEAIREPVARAVRAAVSETAREHPDEWKWLHWQSHFWSLEMSR